MPDKKVSRCYIHIGMHKTGSTAIQKNLAKSKSNPTWNLMQVGGRANMGPSLYAMFHDNPQELYWFKQRGETREAVLAKGKVWLNELAQAIEANHDKTCIISSEFLSGCEESLILRFKNFLTPFFDEIRVIGYVRAPISYKISQFQEALKYFDCEFNMNHIHLNYRSMFEKFDAIFGKNFVTLRKFDPLTFPERCIVKDFCQQLGIEPPITITRNNDGLSREACGMLYAYRKLGPGYGMGEAALQENNRIIRSLSKIEGDGLKVHHDLMRKDILQMQDDIQWMESRLNVSLMEREEPDSAKLIRNENDFLTISRSSCQAFATHFGKSIQQKIPDEWIPKEDPANPADVSNLLENCRLLARETNLVKISRLKTDITTKNNRNKFVKRLRRIWKFIDKFKTFNSQMWLS